MGIIELWDLAIFEPMLNGLITVYSVMFHNFGLAIIALTIVVRLLMLPLTLKQLRASRAMSVLQPKLQELQKKYGKDKEKLAQEQMRLYKESGVSPAGCVLPMLIQLPIWIALYQSIMRALAASPEDLLALSQHLYSWPVVHQVVPLGEYFLWLNLAQPDRYILLPILVAGSMWVQQKMIVTPTADPRQQSMNKMMQWMMPMMFGFFTLQFASGLAVYWVTSNLISIVIQYFITGWGSLVTPDTTKQIPKQREAKRAVDVSTTYAEDAPAPMQTSEYGKRVEDGKPGSKREDSGGGDRVRPGAARRQPRRGGGRRSQKR